MELYKIKEEYKKLSQIKDKEWVKDGDTWHFLVSSCYGDETATDFTDEMFEKVEERIELYTDSSPYAAPSQNVLVMKSNNDFTQDQCKLCEKVLNGDMVEKALIVEWIERYLVEEAFIERLAKIVGYKLPKRRAKEPKKLDDGFTIINNTEHELFVNQKSKEIIIGEKTTKETLTDTGTFRRDEYKKEREAEEEGDTYILKDSQSTFIRKTFTKEQVIEMHNEWLLTRQAASFKEHVNKK